MKSDAVQSTQKTPEPEETAEAKKSSDGYISDDLIEEDKSIEVEMKSLEDNGSPGWQIAK